MSWLHRLVNTFRPAPLERDIDRGFAFHIREPEDELRTDGLSADEARRRARLQFGHTVAQRERTRDVVYSKSVHDALWGHADRSANTRRRHRDRGVGCRPRRGDSGHPCSVHSADARFA